MWLGLEDLKHPDLMTIERCMNNDQLLELGKRLITIGEEQEAEGNRLLAQAELLKRLGF